MEIVLKARSSSQPEPYSVVFRWEERTLKVRCSCPAGELGQMCKHKTALLLNDSTMLFDKRQADSLGKVSTWVSSTSIPSLLTKLRETELETEQAIARAKKALASAKQSIARQLMEGVQ